MHIIWHHILPSAIMMVMLSACSTGTYYAEKVTDFAREKAHFSLENGFDIDWMPASLKEDGYDIDVKTSKLYIEREMKFSAQLIQRRKNLYAPAPPREAPDDYVVPVDAIKEVIAAEATLASL